MHEEGQGLVGNRRSRSSLCYKNMHDPWIGKIILGGAVRGSKGWSRLCINNYTDLERLQLQQLFHPPSSDLIK